MRALFLFTLPTAREGDGCLEVRCELVRPRHCGGHGCIHAPFQSALPHSRTSNVRIHAPFQSALLHSHAVFHLHCCIHALAMSAFMRRFSPHCCIHMPFSICIAAFTRRQAPHCQGLVRKGLKEIFEDEMSLNDEPCSSKTTG